MVKLLYNIFYFEFLIILSLIFEDIFNGSLKALCTSNLLPFSGGWKNKSWGHQGNVIDRNEHIVVKLFPKIVVKNYLQT